MKQFLSISAIIFTVFATSAQPFTATYNFANVTNSSGTYDPTPPPEVTGIYFGSFEAFGVSNNSNASGRFSFSQWALGGSNGNDDYSSHTGSLNEDKFYEVSLYPELGYSIDLTSITFSVQRSGTGIRTYSVRSYHDDFAANLPASINPTNANLSVQSGNIFYWNNDATTSNQNGSTITLSGPDFTGNTMGYVFRFYGWNAEGNAGTFSIDNVTFTGSVTQIPIIADFYIDGFPMCENTQLSFTDASVSFNGDIVSWQWDFGDGNFSSQQNPQYTYSTCGDYTVSLTVTNSNNESHTTSYMITIDCMPVADFMASSTSGCEPLCVDFTDLSTVNGFSGIAFWEWVTSDGDTLYDQNPQTCFAQGSYDISLTAYTWGWCYDTKTVNSMIDVSPNPVADFTFSSSGGMVNFTNASTGESAYHWDFGDNTTLADTSNQQSPSWTYTETGTTYSVCLTVFNSDGCSDMICKQVNITGIYDISSENIFRVYPNPSHDGLFTIEMENGFGNNAKLFVQNILGEIIKTEKIFSSPVQLNLSQFAAGNYLLKMVSDKGIAIRKITVN